MIVNDFELYRNEESNDIYFKKISKKSNPSKYEIFIGKNRDIFVKTADSIKAFHGNFEKLVGDPKTDNFDPSNIHARLLKTKSCTIFFFILEINNIYNKLFLLKIIKNKYIVLAN